MHTCSAERDIKVVRPLYSVEVTETETAKFETEISEEDVHGNWKLKGDALHQSPVSLQQPAGSCSSPQRCFKLTFMSSFLLQDIEIKEEGTRHMLILYNVRLDMAGAVDFSAANARSTAQLRVKGQSYFCSSLRLVSSVDRNSM